MPSLQALRLIASSDARLFEHCLRRAGLTIVGRLNTDPLRNSLQAESVLAIASTLNEDVDDLLVMTRYQQKLRDIAEQNGYMVGLVEGLDQMPGTWLNPIKIMMKGDNDDNEDDEGAPDKEEADKLEIETSASSGEDPSGGGAPPPSSGAPAMPSPSGGLPMV